MATPVPHRVGRVLRRDSRLTAYQKTCLLYVVPHLKLQTGGQTRARLGDASSKSRMHYTTPSRPYMQPRRATVLRTRHFPCLLILSVATLRLSMPHRPHPRFRRFRLSLRYPPTSRSPGVCSPVDLRRNDPRRATSQEVGTPLPAFRALIPRWNPDEHPLPPQVASQLIL
jgi:hypothetical protein